MNDEELAKYLRDYDPFVRRDTEAQERLAYMDEMHDLIMNFGYIYERGDKDAE